ncbi:endonuclease, partial [Sulfolobus sp. B5]
KTLIIKEKNKKSTLVLVINENEKINFKYILEKLQQARNMNIELVISIVDKYGDVTYYNLSEIKMTK